MATASLPPALEDRLAALASRVRRMRIASGACRLIVAALFAGFAIVLLDAAFNLSVAARCLLETAWLGFVGMLAWRLAVRPWHDEVPLDEIARTLESHFPGLGERLLSLVELRQESDRANGSPQLIAALARDAEVRARELNFNDAFPTRNVARRASVAGIAILAAVALAAGTPGAGEQLRRVALPWHRPTAPVLFEIVVTSGDAVVRRGDPITLTAYLRPKDPSAAVPDAAALVFHDSPDGLERKLPMTGDSTGTFHITRPAVADDFEYRIQVGPAASEWHTVYVADTVELTDRSSVAIAPPEYAANRPAKTAAGFTDFDALQYSTANFLLQFNRPAESALIEWRPDGRSPLEAPDLLTVALAPDRGSGAAAFRMRSNGILRVVLINETGPRKLRTEVAVNVRVNVDTAPKFERVSGLSARVRTVRPGERLVFEFTAVDDVGIGAAELEFAPAPPDGRSITAPITFVGAGTPRAEGRMSFTLHAGAREGAPPLRFRLRVRDNRRVDDAKLGPQEILYPPEGWSELRVSESALPLDQQEVFGQRDSIRESLNAALKEVQESRTETETLRADTVGRSPLPIDHGLRLGAIRARVRKVKLLLDGAAKETALTPDLRAMAVASRDIAERPLHEADDALQRATTDHAADRAAALGTTGAHLREAAERLEELLKRNERLAQDRLDRRRLEALAADQTSLAEKAKPGSGAAREELSKLQRDLLARLNRLIAESDPLKRGVDAAAAREAAKLADEAKALAGMVRDLDAAANRLHAELRKSLLDALAAAQMNFLQRADALQPKLETPMRLAGLAPPKREDFLRIAELIGQDKIVEALTELERLAQALDRMAGEFDRWAAERNDPKLAAQQLAKWQDNFRSRFVSATKPLPFAKLPDAQKLALRGEQTAVLGSTERLRIPSESEVGVLREAALVHLRMSTRRLDGDGVGADMAMKFAVEALTRLAEKLPSVVDRLTRSRAEFDNLRLEQKAIIAAAEQVLRTFDKQVPTAPVIQALVGKFAPLQVRQKKLAEQLAGLDVPGRESRQSRAALAAKTAAADLNDGLPYDAIASLSWSKRELDRLRQALDNLAPADDRASELALKQTEVLRLLLAAGENATARQLEPIVALQMEVFRLREGLTAPEAPTLLRDALESVTVAERSLRNGSTHEEILRRAREAAASLVLLADRLNNRESDRDRVKRLAENRRQAECLAKQLAGKDQNPTASKAARRELTDEIDELMFTRVGAAGQVLKKNVLDAYTRLQNKTEPDRQAGDQKQLAAALAELANSMSEVAELRARPPAAAPGPPDPAEVFLPSKPHAESLREMARRQRELRERTNALSAEMVGRTKPAETNPLAKLEERQRALAAAVELFARALAPEKDASAESAGKAALSTKLAADRLAVGDVRAARDAGQIAAKQLRQLANTAGERAWAKTAAAFVATQEAILSELRSSNEDSAFAAAQQKAWQEALAKKAFELAHRLDLAAKNAPPGDPGGKALAEAADLARKAERMMADAAKKAANGLPVEAAQLRADADRLLQQAAEKAAMAGGPPAKDPPDARAMSSGEAAKDAERAMQRAIGELGKKGYASAAEQAMRRAAEALNRAAAGATSQPPSGKPATGSK